MSEIDTKEFAREPRYVVLKISDLDKYTSPWMKANVLEVGSIIGAGRSNDGKPPFNAVVVEQDWPEFDIVWEMIEARVSGTKREDLIKYGVHTTVEGERVSPEAVSIDTSAQAEFNRAIDHAIGLGVEAGEFLRSWREGDWGACREFGYETSLEQSHER